MTGNPILRNYRSRAFYAGAWLLVTAVQTLAVWVASALPFGYALADSVVFSALFAIGALLLWFSVYYNPWKERNWIFNFIYLKCLAILLLAAWLGVGYVLMQLLFGDSSGYIRFLNISLWWKLPEGLFFYLVMILIYYLYMYVEKVNEHADNEIRLNKLLKDGELNLLKSQINPHFLFNSLNSLNALMLQQPERAQQMLLALSDYLRYTVMATRNEQVELQTEIENSERYLMIEKWRFGEKLYYDFDITPECLSAKIPSMLLQPLFENAVKHGVYESTETVHIHAKIERESDFLKITISNNFEAGNPAPRKGSGTGLKNTHERLRLLYGADASLQARKDDGKFMVIVKIPL